MSHHLFPATAPHSSPFIYEQSEGLRLCWLQLLLLGEEHSVEVWQRLGLELWYLGSSKETHIHIIIYSYFVLEV